MKLTKGNVSRVLVAGGVARSVIVRGRIRGLGGVTEGFEYIKESSDSFLLGYTRRSGSYSGYESFLERRAEKIQKMVALLLEKGFKAEVEETDYVRVTL